MAMGMDVSARAPYVRSLSQLRKNQRPDKKSGKSGKKQPRPGDVRTFSLLPVYEVNTEEEKENMEVETASGLLPATIISPNCSHDCMSTTIEMAIKKAVAEVKKMEGELEDEEVDEDEDYDECDIDHFLEDALTKKTMMLLPRRPMMLLPRGLKMLLPRRLKMLLPRRLKLKMAA